MGAKGSYFIIFQLLSCLTQFQKIDLFLVHKIGYMHIEQSDFWEEKNFRFEIMDRLDNK